MGKEGPSPSHLPLPMTLFANILFDKRKITAEEEENQ
jgi:hypothetical protein